MLCSPKKVTSKAQKKAIYSAQGFFSVLGLWGRVIGPTNPQPGLPGTVHLNVEQYDMVWSKDRTDSRQSL